MIFLGDIGSIDGIFTSSDSLELKNKNRSNNKCNAEDNSDIDSYVMDETQDDGSADSYKESFLQKKSMINARRASLFCTKRVGRINIIFSLQRTMQSKRNNGLTPL